MWLGSRYKKAQDSFVFRAASEASQNTCGSCEKRQFFVLVAQFFFFLREGAFSAYWWVCVSLPYRSGGALKYGGREAVDPIVRHPAILVRSRRKCFLVIVVSKNNTGSCLPAMSYCGLFVLRIDHPPTWSNCIEIFLKAFRCCFRSKLASLSLSDPRFCLHGTCLLEVPLVATKAGRTRGPRHIAM